jgi:exopolysaccharide production protein ExoZ
MSTHRLNTLQAGRGFAALAVLLYHCNDILNLPKYLGYEISPLFLAGKAGVQFFFVLSGFVIYLAHRRDIQHPEALRPFLWKRFRRLYPLLWVILLVLTPVYFAFPNFGNGGERSLSTIISAFLILPIASPHFLLATEWTLRHEIAFYLLFSVLICSRRIGAALLTLWFLSSVFVPWVLPAAMSNAFLRVFLNFNNALFGFGLIVCALYLREDKSAAVGWWSCVLGSVVVAAESLAHWTGRAFRGDELLLGLGFAAFILGVVQLERLQKITVSPMLVFLGEASYAIYLTHYPALSVAAKLITHSALRTHGALCFAIEGFVGLTAGIGAHLLVERPLLRRIALRLA